MTRYLPKYLAMYAVLAVVFATVSAAIGFPSMLGVLLPGLLAALVGAGFVKDHLQLPSERQRAEFTAWAAGTSALLGAALFALASNLAGRNPDSPAAGRPDVELRQVLVLAAVMFALNALTIYVGSGIGARGAYHRIAYPESTPGDSPGADLSRSE